MSAANHLRAASYHARSYAGWKRAEAEASLGMRANDEHARAMAAAQMGHPADAHLHEARAHMAAAAAETARPVMVEPPLPPTVPVRRGYAAEDPIVLPARVVVDDPRSPLSKEVVVESPLIPPVQVAPPPPVVGVPVATAFVAPPPRVGTLGALRDVVNRQMFKGERYFARKANEQAALAASSGALGLPARAHSHAARAQMAGAAASVLRNGPPPVGFVGVVAVPGVVAMHVPSPTGVPPPVYK